MEKIIAALGHHKISKQNGTLQNHGINRSLNTAERTRIRMSRKGSSSAGKVLPLRQILDQSNYE